jgi:hypothetical protein
MPKKIMNNVYAYLRRSSLIIPWFSETYSTYSEASADLKKKRQEKDRILVKVFEVLSMILAIIQTKIARGRSPCAGK